MYSCKQIIAVTNRALCNGNYLEQIEKIAAASPKAIILREKELSEEAYLALAKEVLQIVKKYQVKLILHSHLTAVNILEYDKAHMPLFLLQQHKEETHKFKELGVSVHSVEEAVLAERLGATYLAAGHIFATDCKKGLEPRGVSFLEEVVGSVNIPVYAIGGINKENMHLALGAGAAGVCMMSEFMRM